MRQLKKLPASTGEFKLIRKENKLYVDKTKYLFPLVEEGLGKYFFRRPRRFGKSLTISTLEALLQGHKELFEGLWIYDKWDWISYSVVRFDFSKIGKFSSESILDSKINNQIIRNGMSNGVILLSTDSWEFNLEKLIEELKAKGPVAILIDEYDSPFLISLDLSKELQDITQITFRTFFSNLKSSDTNFDFIFITGITKMAKTSVFSGMNSIEDISLEPQFAALCGITQVELESDYSDHIDRMANEKNSTRIEVLDNLKSLYNGYRFSPDSVTRVYNPFSLNHALKFMKLRKYWFHSGPPTLLINLIKKNGYDLSFLSHLTMTDDEMSSSYEFSSMTLKNLLYDTGYLTIQQDSPGQEILPSIYATGFPLAFPNEEVRTAFASSILDSLRGKPTSEIEMKIGEKLVEALKDGRWEDFTKIWNQLLSHIPFNLHIPNESNYHSLFILFAMLFGFDAQAERKNSLGLMDMAVELEDKIFIIEFKLNAPAEDVLKQIHEKRYFEVYLVKNKPIFLVGISFDSKLKQISGIQLEDLQLKKSKK